MPPSVERCPSTGSHRSNERNRTSGGGGGGIGGGGGGERVNPARSDATAAIQQEIKAGEQAGGYEGYMRALEESAVETIKAMKDMELEEMHQITVHGLQLVQIAFGTVLSYVKESMKERKSLRNPDKNTETGKRNA